MRKRLVLAAVSILILPLWFSPSLDDKPTNSAPFAAVALAGHTLTGEWCRCDTFGCFCDSDEQPQGQNLANRDSEKEQSTTTDLGGLGLLAMTMLLLWLKLRAY